MDGVCWTDILGLALLCIRLHLCLALHCELIACQELLVIIASHFGWGCLKLLGEKTAHVLAFAGFAA